MKFAHLGDCHLGSWRQPELQELNFQSFHNAIDRCIEEKVEFILIAGDLFDSAYPPVEILKRTFAEFRRIKEADIRVFMVAGSHDYSVSGKTFLSVLEKAGFCDICKFEEDINEQGECQKINLIPIKYKGFEILGYPGKKSGLEVQDITKIQVPESSNFRILMLHTSIKEALGTLPIESVSLTELPDAEYYALGHLHIKFEQALERNRSAIYSGPIFPNSFQELEDLGLGSFYIIDVEGFTEAKRQEIKLKEVLPLKIELSNALTGTQQILSHLDQNNIQDKIVLLRIHGELEQGTNADIDYTKIKEYLEEKGAYSFLKNTHKLKSKEEGIKSDLQINSSEVDKVEEEIVKEYTIQNPNKFNNLITPLVNALNLPKQEDEKTAIYETRLFAEISKVLGVNLI
jgi:exonuclease SbcD